MKLFKYISIFLLSIAVIVPATDNCYSATAPKSVKATKKAKSTSKKSKSAPKKTTRRSSTVKQERQQTQRDITETQRKIKDNTRRVQQNLDRLNSLNAQIDRQQISINTLTGEVSRLETAISLKTDSISHLTQDITLLKNRLKQTMRDARSRRQRLSPMAMVFSASSFNDAIRRLGLLNRLRQRQTATIDSLDSKINLLDKHRIQLNDLKQQQNTALNKLSVAHDVLVGHQAESEKLDRTLKSEGANLKRLLEEKRRRMRQLDAELDRIIAAEAAAARRSRTQPDKPQTNKPTKPQSSGTAIQGNAQASRTLDGPFASNKGRLLFPVAGSYTITGTFGRGERAGLAIDNSGIDISVASGTKARAVFDGTVTSIFIMSTYHNVVIVRHGAYLTVYAGLSSVNVSKGQSVRTGQTIGTIATDATTGRTELHFEVRHERQKLNPLQWVR